MKTPFHRFKNAYRAVGVGKPDSWSFCEFYGWLGSGLEDINGKEIFEGDIVEVYFTKDKPQTYTVAFLDGNFKLNGTDVLLDEVAQFDIEVVAHITLEEP